MPQANARSILFISSVQKELAAERRALKQFVHGDPLLRRFFDVFLFEDLPASGRRADHVYLSEVDRCDVYVGLFGQDYGYEDATGVSPTEREFDRATARGKERLVFVKGASDATRHPKMMALIRKAGDQVIRRRLDHARTHRRCLCQSRRAFGTDRRHPQPAFRCGRVPARHARRSVT